MAERPRRGLAIRLTGASSVKWIRHSLEQPREGAVPRSTYEVVRSIRQETMCKRPGGAGLKGSLRPGDARKRQLYLLVRSMEA